MSATGPNHNLSRFIDAGGLRWHVQQSGQGPRLLLVHGAASSTHTWRDVLPILARHYTVLAVDLPGHGLSGLIPVSQSSIVGVSNLLAALLAEIHFDPSVVVGHSAGAVILCNMAIGHQINPRVIVSINGAFLPLLGTAGILISQLAKLFARRSFLPRMLARRAFDRENVARVLEATGSHLDDEGIDLYAQLMQRPEHILGALRMMSQWDLTSFNSQLRMLTQPLALLVARDDKAVPLQQAIEVMEYVKNATLYPIPDLGHLAHEERPDLVVERILQIVEPYAIGERAPTALP